jgi:hypothetical protein
MLSTFEEMEMLARPSHCPKAKDPMVVMESGIVMVVRPKQPEKALDPIVDTGRPAMARGIVTEPVAVFG